MTEEGKRLSPHLDTRLPPCNNGDMETTCVRVRRTVAEKRRIVELTLKPGASVARVAQAEG